MSKLTYQEVKFWIDEGKKCIDRQKIELVKRNNYPFLILYYEGIEKVQPSSPFVTTAETYAIINEYFPNTNAKITELMYQNPDILLTATKPNAEEGIDLMKAALTYGFNKTDALVEQRVALFDMLYAGYCAVEVDHIIDKGTLVDNLPSEEDIAKREEANKGFIQKTIEAVKDKIKGVGTQEQIEQSFESELPPREEAYATNEKTYIRRWSPSDIPLDYRANVLKDRRYNMKRIELTQAEFDAKYPAFKDKVKAADNTYNFEKWDNQDHKKKVELYEFQIKKKNYEYWNLVICPSYPEEEIELYKRPYIHNGFNVKIGTLHKYGKLYPISYAQINKKMQDEMNHYVKWLMDVAERTTPKYIIDGNKVKQDGVEALRSANVNDVIKVEGNTAGAITPLQPTQASAENKQLLDIFADQKQKLWQISQSRLQGASSAKFATTENIKEVGFQNSNIDIQEGLRLVIVEQMEALKDIIVNFWDGEYFFKVTGGNMPQWYIPQKVLNPMTGKEMIINPLTDILTGDYEVNIDILSAMRPNKESQKKELVEYVTWLLNVARPFLLSKGLDVNPEEIKKTSKLFNLNPETLFIALPPPMMTPQGLPGQEPTQPQGAPPINAAI